ncbi:MAG TPA: hypothetical protein VEA80_03670 [Vitreimonas sp.]|uniref:hypothetical protein n=1 Tax=Vitreimonas sp. TaxID=3069702 RepID=UPI002D4A45D7|nr:hypothetical protein [Vitreimonas sp.]HYD86548.1 hypothetical protein [Vitreimonas sp.]
MPLVALAAISASADAAERTKLLSVAVTAAVAASVVVFGMMQVRAGRWRDSDASAPSERVELNLFLAALLAGTAALSYMNGEPIRLVAGFALAGAIVLAALALRHLLKLSLHVAFAAFGAGVLWPAMPIAAVLLSLFAAAVAWSRLELKRHTLNEVVVGAVAGAAAASLLLLVPSAG